MSAQYEQWMNERLRTLWPLLDDITVKFDGKIRDPSDPLIIGKVTEVAEDDFGLKVSAYVPIAQELICEAGACDHAVGECVLFDTATLPKQALRSRLRSRWWNLKNRFREGWSAFKNPDGIHDDCY